MADWKDEMFKAAMKVMKNPTAQKVMGNEKVQKAVGKAFQAGFQVKNELDDRKAAFAKRLNLATSDDLRTMKRELDRLQRQVARLKKEKKAAEEGD
jgi:hypothetical protein